MTKHKEELHLPAPGSPDQVDLAEGAARRILASPEGQQTVAFMTSVLAYRKVLADEFPNAAKPLLDESTKNFGDAVLAKIGELLVTLEDTAGYA